MAERGVLETGRVEGLAEKAELEMEQEGQGRNREEDPAVKGNPAGIGDGESRASGEKRPGEALGPADLTAGYQGGEIEGREKDQRGEQAG